ncbi:MAG: DUF421 domain-containing protein [bacterium]
MHPYLEIIFRSTLSFSALLLLVRLMGKQQISEMTFFDYIVGITIGSIAADLSVMTEVPAAPTLLGMVIWCAMPVLLAAAGLHRVWLRKVVEGEAVIVIANGKILEQNLRKLRITLDDLLAQLRVKDVFKISDVEFALFEANGRLSVLKKTAVQPVSRNDFNIPLEPEGLPTNLVMDGILLKDALASLHLTPTWLLHHLAANNIAGPAAVFLAQIDVRGNLHLDFYGERPSLTIKTGQPMTPAQ